MRSAANLALVAWLVAAAFLATRSARGTGQSGAANASSPSPNPQQIYESLRAAQVDGSRVYSVHELALRRDGITFTFADGKLAFLQPVNGHTVGAVFLGRGHAFAVPPDPAERASLARFLHIPLIDTDFSQAYLGFDENTAAQIRNELSVQNDPFTSDTNFAINWDPIVPQLNAAVSLRALEELLSQTPKPYLYAALNSAKLEGFDVIADERRPETVLVGQPRRSSGVDFFDVWTSYVSANAPPHTEDFAPVDYSIETTINDDLTLTGNTTVHLKCLAAGERVLELELSRFLQVQTVTDGTGQTLTFFQNQDLRRQEIARRGNDLLFVVLPAPAVESQRYELHVTYHGAVIQDDGNAVYFVGARGSWYPHLAGKDQFASFDLKFRWPRQLRLVATGDEIENGETNRQRTGHWHSTQPIAVAGFNLGDYAVESVSGKPAIQLFANHQLENGIAEQLRQRALDQAPGTRDALQLLPSPSAVLKELGTRLLDSVHYYDDLNGPFPFHQLDVSQIPGSFGQGWPGLLYLTTLVFLPPEAQQQIGLAQHTQEEVQDLVPFHEVVHQWWGNVVVPASYRDGWIEEAMADYQSLMYAQKRNPSKRLLQEWLLRYRDALLRKEPGADQAIEQAGPLDFGYRLDSSKSPDAYRTIIYQKGAWVIHMLRMMLRDPRRKNPDARFEELLKNTLADHRFQTLSTKQFETEVDRLITPSMDLENTRTTDWFFDQWVRHTGIPEYNLTFSVRPRESRFLVEGSLAQRNVAGIFTERVPIYGAISQGKPVFLGDVVTTGLATPFRFASRFRPVKLLIDPEHTILCQTK